MTNLELSQTLGFNNDIIGQIFNDGIRDYRVIGINVAAKRFPIQYVSAQSGSKYAMSIKAFRECAMCSLQINDK